ncbi:MAG TPA: TonB-dependent receptor, partial [Terriglobus sp.]
MSYRHKLIPLSAIAATLIVGAHAQTITGSIRGTVKDSSGALVPDSRVTARNVNTGVEVSTKSDATGTYVIQSLPIGTYTLTTTHDGFSQGVTSPFSLEIDQIARIDVRLNAGGVDTTVSVDATAGTLLQTENATLATTIDTATLSTLPLSGQNFSSATMFVPGAVNPTYNSMGGPNGTERDLSPATIPSFNGNRQQTNNYILDGADINEPLNNVIGYNIAPEALQQIRVITGNADAEYGNVNGGEILMVTKGGTNQFHGSLYGYYENQALTANLWSNNYNHLAKGAFHQSQFGATFGGPIIKNKLFFFVDYEGFRNGAASNLVATVATPLMRTGDFSELLGLNGGSGLSAANRIQLFNTTNGTTAATKYANNIIPVNNPVARFLFAHPELYPLPNHVLSTPTSSVDAGNYVGTSKSVIVNNQGDARVDYVLSSHDTINARYTYSDAWDATPKTVLPITFPGGNEYPTTGGVINEVHTFGPNFQNAFRAGYTRIGWLQGQPIDSTGAFGLNGNSLVGIGYTPQPFAGFSQINLSSSESNVGTRATATTYYDNVFNYGDDVVWLRGRHIIKFGAQVLRYQENNFYPSADGALGTFAYNGSFTTGTTGSAPGYKTTGYGFADFVLDKSSSNGVGGVTGRVGARQYRVAGYIQDDWKLTPRLTLNIGLRYGWDQPMYEVNNKQVNVDTDHPETCPNCLQIAGQNGNSRALYNPFYKQYMPRLGFAYQASPVMVIRGGYGITDDMEGTGANLRMTQNPPFVFQYLNT